MHNNTTATPLATSDDLGKENDFLAIVIIRAISTVIGVFGNGLVLLIIPRKKKRKTNNDIFLINLAFADLLYILFADFRYLYGYLVTTPKSLLYCKVIFPILNIPYNVGIFTITVMAIQRCRVILNPWRPKQRNCYTYLWVALTWILSVVVVLPLVIFGENRYTYCPLVAYGWNEHATFIYILSLAAIQYPIPLLIISFAYVRIGIYMSKPRVPRLSVIAKGNELRSPRDETRKESIQITKTVGAIVLLFVILMLPTQIAMICGMIFKMMYPWVYRLWDYGDVLGTVNSCLNPFVYSARSKEYRELIAKWFTWLCPRCAAKRRTYGSRCSRNDRSVFPTGHDKSFTNVEVLRTVEDVTIDFPENKGSMIRKLSLSMKNGCAKQSEDPC